MKRILTALLIGLSLTSFAQVIPAVKSTVSTTTHIITFVDGVVINLVGSNTIATRKTAYLKAVKPPVIVTPPVIASDYTKTYRYSLAQNAYKFGLLPAGAHITIPPSKGAVRLNYEGTNSPTLGMPYVTKDGLLFFQNQLNTYYMANISVEPRYPNEMWYVWYKPDYFIFEKYMEEPFYMGDLGQPVGIRFSNEDNAKYKYQKAVTPLNKPFIVRVKTTENGTKTSVNVEFWIDGVKQANDVQAQTWYRNHFTIGAGVNTNNEYVGWAEVFNTAPLSDEQAAKVTAELQAEYKPYDLPIATDLKYAFTGSTITVSYKYSGKLPEGKTAKVRWVEMIGGPDKARYRTEYDGKFTIPAPFSGRAEITVYDTNGNYFDIPSTKLAR